MGGGGRREIQEGVDIYAYMADSLCCTAEMNTTNTIKQLYTNKIIFQLKKKRMIWSWAPTALIFQASPFSLLSGLPQPWALLAQRFTPLPGLWDRPPHPASASHLLTSFSRPPRGPMASLSHSLCARGCPCSKSPKPLAPENQAQA